MMICEIEIWKEKKNNEKKYVNYARNSGLKCDRVQYFSEME